MDSSLPAARQAISAKAGEIKDDVAGVAGGPARLQVIAVLASVLALDAADKATISAVAGSLEQAFNIGNAEIGLLIAVVSFIGAITTLPIGSLIDRLNRARILVIAIALWSFAMAVSGAATSFLFMLLTRLALGAVTATAFPTVASLTGDFFPARDRSHIYGFILAGELVGTGIGFFISGELSAWFDWRLPFFVIAALGAGVAWVVWRYLPEPARGGQSWIDEGDEEVRSKADVEHGQGNPAKPPAIEQPGSAAKVQEIVLRAGVEPRQSLVLHQDPTRRSLWWAAGYVLRVPTYVLLIIASSLGYYFFAGIRSFGMIYMTDHYHVARGAVSGLALVIGIGALAGVLCGGWVSRRLLERKWFAARVVVPGIALAVAAVFFAPAVWTTSLVVGIPLLTAGAFMLAAANPPIDAARLDIMHPRLWGRSEAGSQALRSALEGGAPLLFGLISEWLGGGGAGLKWTFLLMLIPLLIAGSLAIPARRTYPRDVATAGVSVEATKRQGARETTGDEAASRT